MFKKRLKLAYHKVRRRLEGHSETNLLLLGKQMAWQVGSFSPNTDFRKVGFRVFSQWDEDGIIQYLIHKLPIPNQTFIEFGTETYEESNTRFLLMNNHWRGMVLDASKVDVDYIQNDPIYWQYDLQVKQTWITRQNINDLVRGSGFSEDVGLLSIDIDGNDYWIWEAITAIRPIIVVIEYNSLLGLEPLSVPYREDFSRTSAHYSNLYYGCSLGALRHLAHKKGYILLGSNVWGHNAFFIRADIAGEFRELDLEQAYVQSKFRESRNREGKPSYVRGDDRMRLIESESIVNVVTGAVGHLKDYYPQFS